MSAILWERFVQLKKNPKIFIAMLLLPLIFSFAFSGMEYEKINIPVVNLDKSEISYRFIDRLNNSDLYNPIEMERDKAVTKISEEAYEVGIIIPDGFSDQLENNKQPVVQLLSVKDSAIVISFEGVLKSILQNLQYNVNIVTLSLKTFDQMDLAVKQEEAKERLFQLTEENWQHSLPIEVKSTVANGKVSFIYDHKLQILLGFTLFFSIYTIIFSLSEILNDKKNKVWDKIIISPLNKVQIYIGNLLYSFFVGFSQVALLVLIGKYIMGVNWGDNLLIIFVVIALYIFAVMALGMLLISLSKTPQQLNAIVPVIAVSMAMLGGAYWPLEIVSSKILLTVAEFMPIMHAMTAIKDVVLYNKGWEAVLLPGSILFLMGIFLMGIGVHLIERKTI